eukprot:Skav210326  [mRNA]  locus=scaffold475:349401:357011:- [translate_table: standard]
MGRTSEHSAQRKRAAPTEWQHGREGLVTSRMPGFGRGVPPSTRIQNCVAVAFSEAEVTSGAGAELADLQVTDVQIRQDVEALTGLKTAQLFKALDVRGNGYVSLEDLVCSVTPQQQCACAQESNCISEAACADVFRKEMESKRRLVQRLAAEAEAAFARKKGAAVEDEAHGLEEPLLETRGLTKGERESQPGARGVTKSAQAKKLARASAEAQEPFELRRLRLEVTSLVVDPKRPRVAAGARGRATWTPRGHDVGCG